MKVQIEKVLLLNRSDYHGKDRRLGVAIPEKFAGDLGACADLRFDLHRFLLSDVANVVTVDAEDNRIGVVGIVRFWLEDAVYG